jgi:hypothetical protein
MRTRDEKPLKTLPGVNGTLELYADHVRLRWTGFQSLFHLGEKPPTIATRDITGVEMYSGQNPLTNEFMRLSISRGQQRSIVLIFQRRYHALAMQFRDTLDDLSGNRDVLPVVRAMRDEARK